MDDSKILTVDLSLHSDHASVLLQFGYAAIAIAAALVLAVYFIAKARQKGETQITAKKITLNIGGHQVEYEIERNFSNLEIAHRIYIELITRKAAIPIDENNDILTEVYDSWYSLFTTTRDEIKNIKGELLSNTKSNKLIELTTGVLNDALRPHLTEHQGRFRSWYARQASSEENTDKSPQELQALYPEYGALIVSMKSVNDVLRSYADQLREFIYGDQ
ncbi:MAG: hypothetical protein ABW072_13080 [Sedimenticola sp.]